MATAVKAMPEAELQGRPLLPDELQQIDIFKDVDVKMLLKFPGTVSERRFLPGQIICREGEGGTTAFYILSGEVDVNISRQPASARAANLAGGSGIVASIKRWLGHKPAPSTPRHHADKLLPIDAGVDLTYSRRAGTLGAGEVFGEMSCLNLAPRSATIVARSECVMLEILRNMYEVLQRGKTFKQRMDTNYRERALANHLRNVPMLASLEPQDIELLRDKAELVTVDAGQVIFREGDDADAFYMIRLGQVRVSKKAPGGEQTLAYLTKGDCFGETGLLRGDKRNATCAAVDHPVIEGGKKRKPARCELVKISSAELSHILQKYPLIKGQLELRAEQNIRAQKPIANVAISKPVEELGLLQGQNLMLIDLTRCTRCDQCVDACVDAHDDGLSRLIRSGPKLDKYLVPSSCRMCVDPVCMIGCPVGSIRRGEDLNILIEDWCVGCGVCARQCPYESIQMHPLDSLAKNTSEHAAKRVAPTGDVVSVTDRAVVCDQCASLPTGPACVYACPHDAASRVNATEFLGAQSLLSLNVIKPSANPGD
jgi:CRP-like cAMP-binding protein/Fe-S-cluster-containing hydrogenase component 2